VRKYAPDPWQAPVWNRTMVWKNHLLELLHISEPRGGPAASRN